MSEDRYILSAEGRDEEELKRLKLQESIVDSSTIRHLETIGIKCRIDGIIFPHQLSEPPI